MMKIGLIGAGKTGQHVVRLAQSDVIVGPFNSQTPIDVDQLNHADVVIIFIPAHGLKKIWRQVLEIKKPVLIGTTGFDPSELQQDMMIKPHSRIIWARNFSLGIFIFHQIIKTINQWKDILPSFSVELEETHHLQKVDAPSGTSLALGQTAQFPVRIKSIREGDVVGDHVLSLKFPLETIEISHRAHDREVFAAGAIKIAQLVLNQPPQPGFHLLEDYLEHYFLKRSV